MSSHHRDVMNDIKEQITSVINKYNYAQFITDRLTIQNEMGYQIGVKLKQSYYCELTAFVLNQVILEETHENSYINLLVTNQKASTQIYLNSQNQITAETETLAGISASTVATTKNEAEVSATEQFYTKKATADAALWSNYNAGLTTLQTTLGTNFANTDSTTQKNFLSF